MISLILGLGNTGDTYDGTRHNVGFEVVSLVSKLLKATDLPLTSDYRLARAKCGDKEILLAWPTTLMNRSGLAALDLVNKFGLSETEMLVVVDDFNLPLGHLRIRPDGSDGGHNGLASLIESLNCDAFSRMRLGIGAPQEGKEAAEFVLEPFTKIERPEIDRMVAKAAEAAIFAIDDPLQRVMSKYNNNPAPPELS